jgi:hypothetical protein
MTFYVGTLSILGSLDLLEFAAARKFLCTPQYCTVFIVRHANARTICTGIRVANARH